MKTIKSVMKLLSVLLLSLLFLIPVSEVSASKTEEILLNQGDPVSSESKLLDPTELYESDIEYSEMINQEFNGLLSYWGGDYPDYYAGSFISNRQFTILVTCEPQEIQAEIWNVTGNSDIIIEKASCSYNDLRSIQDQITELITELRSNNNSIANLVVGIGVDEVRNDVFVEVLNMDENVRRNIEEILAPFGTIRLVSKNEPYQEMTTVTAGTDTWLTNSTLNSHSTIGFCASRVNSAGVTEKGFVTAGHSGNLTNTMTIFGSSVGKISWRKFGGNCDACFVNMNEYPNSGFVRSTVLSSYYTIGSYASVSVVGTTYALHGKSSGIIYGTVDCTSFNFSMSGVSFTDHIRMNMHVVSGDSGGPLVGTSSGSTKYVVGICSSGDSTYSNFTKATNIINGMSGDLFH
ncbi:MAG: hypothetical protein IKG93_11795 [Clostridiales bacterium]|nr:hypothetical protein [Clostridiales bacterium]